MRNLSPVAAGVAARTRSVVFDDTSAYAPFRDSLGCRLLLHPIRPPLDPACWSSIATAATVAGDTCAYVHQFGEKTTVWSVSLQEYDAYEEITSVDDQTIWSPRGIWGMFVSLDDYAVFAAASRKITEAMASAMPDLPQFVADDDPRALEGDPFCLPSWSQIDEFEKHWAILNKGAIGTWTDEVLAHVRASASLCPGP